MEITVDVYSSILELPEAVYAQFYKNSNGNLFYDRRFLIAAEQSPLLAVKNIFYLTARSHGELLAFLPVYLQDLSVVDPFQILAKNAGIHNHGEDTGLFSHIMHCFDSTILSREASLELHDALFCRLRKLAMTEGASYFGLLNVQDPFLLKHAGALGMNVNFMLERWNVELSGFRDFEEFIEKLPYDGRNEMRRQLRKFKASQATLSMLKPPFDERLNQLAQLCQETTARHGTPDYFPAAPLTRFSQLCGELIRLNLIELDGKLVAGMVCFEQQDTLHLWSAGMRYDQIDFSPYTLAFANAYIYAFENGLKRIEAGRLNAKIKARLGLQPESLYTVTSERIKHSA